MVRYLKVLRSLTMSSELFMICLIKSTMALSEKETTSGIRTIISGLTAQRPSIIQEATWRKGTKRLTLMWTIIAHDSLSQDFQNAHKGLLALFFCFFTLPSLSIMSDIASAASTFVEKGIITNVHCKTYLPRCIADHSLCYLHADIPFLPTQLLHPPCDYDYTNDR